MAPSGDSRVPGTALRGQGLTGWGRDWQVALQVSDGSGDVGKSSY